MAINSTGAATRPFEPAPAATGSDAQPISPELMTTLMQGVARAIRQSLAAPASTNPGGND